jgi:hypothetical protein
MVAIKIGEVGGTLEEAAGTFVSPGSKIAPLQAESFAVR